MASNPNATDSIRGYSNDRMPWRCCGRFVSVALAGLGCANERPRSASSEVSREARVDVTPHAAGNLALESKTLVLPEPRSFDFVSPTPGRGMDHASRRAREPISTEGLPML